MNVEEILRALGREPGLLRAAFFSVYLCHSRDAIIIEEFFRGTSHYVAGI